MNALHVPCGGDFNRNSFKLGTYCNPSDNDVQPVSPMLLPQT